MDSTIRVPLDPADRELLQQLMAATTDASVRTHWRLRRTWIDQDTGELCAHPKWAAVPISEYVSNGSLYDPRFNGLRDVLRQVVEIAFQRALNGEVTS